MIEVPDQETLYTHAAFWGVDATPTGRGFCRIVQGLALGELASCNELRLAVGGDEALAVLAPGGVPPRQVSIYAAVRTGKSDLASCIAFRASQTIDVSHLRGHEVPRIPIASLTTDTANVAFQHLLGRLHKPSLRPLLVREGADWVIVRHPSGAEVEIRVTAGARAGGNLVGRWLGAIVFDEKPRMLGSADGAIINYDDALTSAEARLLDGGQIIDIGSLWAPFGPAFNDVQNRFGKPTPQHVVLRARGDWLHPKYWTPARMRALEAKNPRAYRTDALGEFGEVESSAIPSELVTAACERTVPTYCSAGPWVIVGDLSAMLHDAVVLSLWRWLIPLPGNPHLWADGRASDGSVVREAFPLRDDDGDLVPNPDYAKALPVLHCGHIEGWEPALGHRVTSGMVADRVRSLSTSVRQEWGEFTEQRGPSRSPWACRRAC